MDIPPLKINNMGCENVLSTGTKNGCGKQIKQNVSFEDFTVGSRVQMGDSKKVYIVFQNDSRGLILKPE